MGSFGQERKEEFVRNCKWKICWIFDLYRDRYDLLASGIQGELVFNWMERSPQGR